MQGLEKKNDTGRHCNRMDPYTSSPLNVYQGADGLARGMETSPPDDYMYHQHNNSVLSSHCLHRQQLSSTLTPILHPIQLTVPVVVAVNVLE